MAVYSATLDSTIEGLNYDDDGRNNNGFPSIPPDPTGAAGPSHLVNATNSSIQWFTKAGVQQMHQSLTNFYAPLLPGPFIFDPKVTYDQHNGRFVVVALELLDQGNGDAVNASRVLVGVSDDSDPNGTWHYQSVNSLQQINTEPQWLDYPGLAVDKDAIYITGNMFPFSNGSAAPGGSRLIILGKGSGTGGLYDGGLSTANIYNPAGSAAATQGFTLQPAHVFGNTPVFGNTSNKVGTWLVAYNGGAQNTTEQMMVIRVDSPLNNPTFDIQNVALGDIDNSTNLGYPTVIAPETIDAPQKGTTRAIETNDRRTLNAVWRDNALWTVFQVIPPTGPDAGQTTVHWVKVNTSNPGTLVVADQGNIGAEEIGGTIYTYMPSIAVDAAGNATVGFAASGPGLYASAYYATRTATDPAGEFRIPRPLAVGLDSYERDFGGPENRWGDYSATVLDPADGATFWVYNQYAIAREAGSAGDDGRWGTRWGSLHIADTGGSGGGGGGGGGGSTTSTGSVSGVKWNDLDGDGVRDSNEPGVSGFTFYLDINSNDIIDVGEPAASSDANGNFKITTQYFGTFAVREVAIPGWQQTYPGQTLNYETSVTIAADQNITGLSFGNKGNAYDFGDAPTAYPTTLAKDGARHAVRAGFHLGPPTVNVPTGATIGVEPDIEADGQPDAAAAGDDLGGVDDEDGVIFNANSLIAGQTASISVIVSTGGLSSGRLQGWIDFNGDGDWSDPGEQIVKNRTLAQGTHTITFPVPLNATRQPTFARFRYGFETDLGPTGVSVAGEVEDYQVQVLTDEPLANDDTYTVDQNSINNILAVLANDFASSSGTLKIDSPTVITQTASGGTVQLSNNGTPTDTTDDVLLYTPLNGYTGPDSFTYIISDASGKTDSATVSITVISILNDPIAVDDSFTIAANSSGQVAATSLDVLANDVTGNKPPIVISSVTQPGSGQGTVSITSAGTRILYTPPSTSFAGDIQFTYTIRDQTTTTPKTSTALVTLHVGNSATDDVVQVRLQAFDLDGNPISVITPGEEFNLRAFVKDVRTDDTVPPSATDRLGVYAAYFDMLYDSKLVSITAPIVFNGDQFDTSKPWTSGQSVNTSTPGMLNETGAFQGNQPLFTQSFSLLFTQRMRANPNATGEAKFVADPADVLPLHDILVFEPPAPAVDFTKITYGTTSLFIGNPADVLFKAVDDTFSASATSQTSMAVMANDLQGTSTPVVIDSIPSRSSGFQGTLAISGTNIVYTPPVGGFPGSGTQQFTYRLRNASGATQDATVTMQIGPNTAADDTVQIRLAATNSSGAAITSVNVGDTFQIRVFVKDLRSDDGDGDSSTDRRGVGAAYFDMLYSYKVASVVPSATNALGFDVTFGSNYTNGKSGDALVPGLIDESGAFQTGSSPLGISEQLLYVVNFKADVAGTFNFLPDPANESPAHDVVLFEPTVPVSIAALRLLGGSITVNGGGGEGEFTNPANALDVNNDGYVTAIDALLVINDMNKNGSRIITSGGEGESGTTHYFVDVNSDRYVSAIDALMVINYLNSGAGGEGEAPDSIETAPEVALFDAPVHPVDEVTLYTMAAGTWSDDAATEEAVDGVFEEFDDANVKTEELENPEVIYYSTAGGRDSSNVQRHQPGDGYVEFFQEMAQNALRWLRRF